MGTKYGSGTTVSGYNASPPPDDASTSASNQVTWAKHTTKIGDPLNTAIAAINAALVAAFNYASRSISASDSAVIGDNDKTLQTAAAVSTVLTITLSDAATMAASYRVKVANLGTADVIIARATAGDTINGVAQNLRLGPGVLATFLVNAAANGYLVEAVHYPDNAICEGRLSLTTATPITTTDVTAATTLYFTPFKGNRVSLFDGTIGWSTFTFQELTYTVPSTSSTLYDAFLHNNAGALAITATAWTNDTTRATAIAFQHGVYVKSGTPAHRYIGSFRTTGTAGQTEDSSANRFIWNYYNRVTRPQSVVDGTDSWQYTTATWRQKNNSTANQVRRVIGVAEDSGMVVNLGLASNSGNVSVGVGVGLNSVTVNSAQSYIGNAATGASGACIGRFDGTLSVGMTTIAALEISTASGTTTWYGDNGALVVQTGMSAVFPG